MLARPNPTVSNCGLGIVQVDQQGHQHQPQNIRQQHRQQHPPENRPICSINALLTPQGIYNSFYKNNIVRLTNMSVCI